MPEEQTFSRGEGIDKLEARKAELDATLKEIFDRQDATPAAELTGPMGPLGEGWWNIYASGPRQAPGLEPARVIEVGEKAYIEWVVRLNTIYPPGPGQNACDIITSHNDKIEIFFLTSNMQTMQPVPALSKCFYIPTTPGQCFYTGIFEFTPQEPGCLYEMNICARICNCSNKPLPQFSGFVTWVRNWDWEWLFRYVPWTFDHPIRFMVASKSDCGC